MLILQRVIRLQCFMFHGNVCQAIQPHHQNYYSSINFIHYTLISIDFLYSTSSSVVKMNNMEKPTTFCTHLHKLESHGMVESIILHSSLTYTLKINLFFRCISFIHNIGVNQFSQNLHVGTMYIRHPAIVK